MSDPDRERGLYGKYRVSRLHDPTKKHVDCRYFVLDLIHDKHAGAALHAYARACEVEYRALADDLREAVQDGEDCDPGIAARDATIAELRAELDRATQSWSVARDEANAERIRAERAEADLAEAVAVVRDFEVYAKKSGWVTNSTSWADWKNLVDRAAALLAKVKP